MNEFPNSTESGVFHMVGSPGLHQLPQEHTSAGCIVKVDIVGDIVADVGSWHGIKKAAAGVMEDEHRWRKQYGWKHWACSGDSHQAAIEIEDAMVLKERLQVYYASGGGVARTNMSEHLSILDLAPSLNSVNLSLPDPANYEFHCNRPPVLPFRLISNTNCVAAFQLFPSYRGRVTFHSLPPDDDYLLPESRFRRDCLITMEMYEGFTEDLGSWAGLQHTTYLLMKECETTTGKTSGGWARTGSRGGILITLRRRGLRGDGVIAE
ncbi:MAG: hypothetical protein Q9190_000744 [Brigantiaea leucoxantha]